MTIRQAASVVCCISFGILLQGICEATGVAENKLRAWEGSVVEGKAVGRACFWREGDRASIRIAVERNDERGGVAGILELGGLAMARIAGADEKHAVLFAPGGRPEGPRGELVIEANEGMLSLSLDGRCRIARARLVLKETTDSQASLIHAALADDVEFASVLAEAAELSEQGEIKRAVAIAAPALGLSSAAISHAAVEAALRAPSPIRAFGALTLANAWIDIYEISSAEPVTEVAESILAEHLPPEHPALLYAAYLRARMLAIRGQWDQAATLHKQNLARQRAELPDDSVDVLGSEIDLAATFFDIGDIEAAQALFERAAPVARRALGERHMISANAVVTLASIVGYKGQHEQARRMLLTMFQNVIGQTEETDAVTAQLLRGYALASFFAGRLQDARVAIDRAAAWYVAELGATNLRALGALELQAWIYGQSERIGEAIVIQRRVLENYTSKLGSAHPISIRALENLGWWYVRDGRYAEASPILNSVYETAKGRFGDNDRRTLDAAVDAGYARFLGGDVNTGCELLAAAARRRSGEPLQNEPARMNALFGLARCQLAAGEAKAALNSFGDVLAYRRKTLAVQSEATVAALAGYARAQLEVGDRSGALVSLQDFVRDAEAMRGAEAPQASGGRAGFAGQVASKDYQAGYQDLALLYAEDERVHDAIGISELARARGIADALSMRIASRDALIPEHDRLLFRRLEDQQRNVEAQFALAPVESARRASLAVERDAIAAELERTKQRLAASSSNRQGGGRLDLGKIRRRLPPHTLIIGYQTVRTRVWAYVLRRDSEPRVVLLPSPSYLAELVTVLHAGLSWPNAALAPLWLLADGKPVGGLSRPAPNARRIFVDEVAKTLGAALIAPLTRDLAWAKHLIIAADGPLALVPFEVLPLRGRPLIERMDVSYVPSLAVWQALQIAPRRPRAAGADLIAFGAPNYVAPQPTLETKTPLSGRYWSPLPGAMREVTAVAAMFPAERRRVFLGADASKANLLALNRGGALADARYLLFAVHGVLSPSTPQWSALILSEANRDIEPNGFITAAELATYELSSELTVLSACETALGKDVAGEGVFGLPFALFVAGSRKTVLTLWPVADEATAQFIERLFAKLKRGAAPARALAATKREFRRDPRYSSPFYWAAFVLYGD